MGALGLGFGARPLPARHLAGCLRGLLGPSPSQFAAVILRVLSVYIERVQKGWRLGSGFWGSAVSG